MSSDYGGDLTVKIYAERPLFGGRLRVDVDEYRRYGAFGDQPLGRLKGTVKGRHEGASLQTENGKPFAVFLVDGVTASACALRMIRGAQHGFFAVQQGNKILLVPDVVAVCEDVDAGGEKLFHYLFGESEATGAVFPVGDDEIKTAVFFLKPGDLPGRRFAAWATHDVADK